jgi:pSer/pThr/pTyr-binding forkhead associated (FHA) protein
VEASPQRLLVRTEGANGIVHVLGRRTTVGRTPDNDLRVEAGFVSRHHAALLLSGADTVVEDLHSTNGTFVNGEQIARRTLREGDVVAFGKIQYRFVIKPAG